MLLIRGFHDLRRALHPFSHSSTKAGITLLRAASTELAIDRNAQSIWLSLP